MKRAVPEPKKKLVAEFVKLVRENPIVGIVNMENLPARQLQQMRKQLDQVVLIRMTKKRLMKIVFDKVKDEKKGIDALAERMQGMPALIFTRENPFSLCKTLQKNKSTAPARAGQRAPRDIVIPAGPTSFAPGPIIGELGALRIKTGIEDGKVVVKEAVTVVKANDEISAKVAGILTRMGIEPMEIGLDLVAVYENGSIFTKDVLSVDEAEYYGRLCQAARDSLALALSIAHASDETIGLLLAKAHADAVALGLAQGIYAGEIMPRLLAGAEQGMLALQSLVGNRKED